jgi:lipid-A-disaccharide synthase
MKYYLIAGEASGDLHASNLIRELIEKDNLPQFRCWGGDLMNEFDEVTLVKHYRDLAFMGFIEVLQNLKTILNNIEFCKKDLMNYQPDVLILVDYPGFNLRIAEFAHKAGIKVFYYISPQIWAWKQSRVHKIKRTVDRMFVILPFEKEFYNKFAMPVDFVGHPLLDAIERQQGQGSTQDFITKHQLDERPIVALLPGSRRQEIGSMLPVMLRIQDRFPNHQFVIGASRSMESAYYYSFEKYGSVKLVKNDTYGLLQHAKAALVTSGTATLETALFKVPEIVCYKGSLVSYTIARKLIKVAYISLVNLIMEREIVKELIQNELTTQRLEKELKTLLFDEKQRTGLLKNYDLLAERLGGKGASEKTASLMIQYLKQ